MKKTQKRMDHTMRDILSTYTNEQLSILDMSRIIFYLRSLGYNVWSFSNDIAIYSTDSLFLKEYIKQMDIQDQIGGCD